MRHREPAAFRAALATVAPADRDAWLDRELGIGDVADDDSCALPRGCVPYLPAPIEKLIEVAEHAGIGPGDVFVDVGCGVGRATAAMHLLTGATAIGLEIQPQLAQASRELAARIGPAISVVEGDAASAELPRGTVFFLYCPFGGDRLTALLASLEALARPLYVGCLDLPLPAAPWLVLVAQPSPGLDIYRSV